MSKKQLIFTILNYLACLTVVIGLSLTTPKNNVKAYTPPDPFLGPIYYGEETILKVFDHRYPLFGEDNYDLTVHYDGSETGDNNGYYGYDEHLGVDYSLYYEPVLAAADGTVAVAGWSDPTDHQRLYGLHVQMVHTANPNYRVWYGHLSSLTVEVGDIVDVDPVNREGIIGISGNTGRMLDGCPPVYENPLCSAHLHIEVRINGKPVNPYGWIGSIPDPWANYAPTATPPIPPGTPIPSGATSYDLWATYPARVASPAQYPDGPTIAEPAAPVAVRTIDDSSSDYSTTPNGCMEESSSGGFNGGYDYTITIGSGDDEGDQCFVKWQITPNSLTPAGFYDVYVHIPDGLNPRTLGASYEIAHNGTFHTAMVVQTAYPNAYHPDSWVYIGRYQFNMLGNGNEYIKMGNLTIDDDDAHFIIADAIQLASVSGPSVTPTATPNATATPTITPQMTIPVTQSSDDAGPVGAANPTPCSTAYSGYTVNKNEIYIGHCNDGANIISGFRFTGVNIPSGAVITKAQIEFTVDTVLAPSDIYAQFRGELVANSSTFDANIRPDNRTLTQSTVLWNIPANDPWTWYEKRYTPDLKTIIQEIVNLPNWQSGNALTIIVQPQPGIPFDEYRRVFAIDREGIDYAAKLQIWYTTPLNTGFGSPSANLAETTGDGNGFEKFPTNAYANDGSFAVDDNSGTSNLTSCTDVTKDRHQFSNFSNILSVPPGSTIAGIEVRLDAKVDGLIGSPKMCILLSQNGGITWTAAKETPLLQTTEGSYVLGGPTDLWGTIWSPGSFSYTNFRVRVVNVSSSSLRDFSLDWVAVKVYYVP